MSLFDNRWLYVGWTTHGTADADYRSFQIQLTLWSRRTWPK